MPQIKTSADTKPADPPTEAELLLDAAILKVKSLENVEAELTQAVSMLGQNFQVTGSYMKGPGYRIRMELNLKNLGDADGTLLQVCDGKVLWDYQRIAQAQNYRRLAIDKILARIEGPEFEQEIRDQIIGSFGFTGPEALLTGLRKSVLFDQKEEDSLDNRKVWILRGFWKDRTALASPGQPAPTGALPPYIPSVIALTIGQEDGWPYKLEMKGRIRVGPSLGGAAEKKAATPAPRPDQVSSLTLTYTNVKLNTELDPAKFAFTAPDPRIVPNVVVIDQTDEWLSRLNEAAAQLAEKARRGGGSPSKGEDPVTPAISIPKALSSRARGSSAP
ncbi:MAG: hypothetical protein U0800_05845 [Isosphaeraceae bacterium]